MTKDDLKVLCTLLNAEHRFEWYANLLDQADKKIITEIKADIAREGAARLKKAEETSKENLHLAEAEVVHLFQFFEFTPQLQEAVDVTLGETSTRYNLIDDDGWVIVTMVCSHWSNKPIDTDWKHLYRYAKKTHNDRLLSWLMASKLGNKIP